MKRSVILILRYCTWLKNKKLYILRGFFKKTNSLIYRLISSVMWRKVRSKIGAKWPIPLHQNNFQKIYLYNEVCTIIAITKGNFSVPYYYGTMKFLCFRYEHSCFIWVKTVSCILDTKLSNQYSIFTGWISKFFSTTGYNNNKELL